MSVSVSVCVSVRVSVSVCVSVSVRVSVSEPKASANLESLAITSLAEERAYDARVFALALLVSCQ